MQDTDRNPQVCGLDLNRIPRGQCDDTPDSALIAQTRRRFQVVLHRAAGRAFSKPMSGTAMVKRLDHKPTTIEELPNSANVIDIRMCSQDETEGALIGILSIEEADELLRRFPSSTTVDNCHCIIRKSDHDAVVLADRKQSDFE
jgi:hypothetical protein